MNECHCSLPVWEWGIQDWDYNACYSGAAHGDCGRVIALPKLQVHIIVGLQQNRGRTVLQFWTS